MARLHSNRRGSPVLASRRLLVAEPKVRDPGLASGGGGTPPTDIWAPIEALKFVVRGPAGQPPPPGGLTAITPGTDTIQAALDSGGPGAKFSLNGTYTLTASVVPYDNQELYNTGSTLIQGTIGTGIQTATGRGNGLLLVGLEVTGFSQFGFHQNNAFNSLIDWCHFHDIGIGTFGGSNPAACIHGGVTGSAGGLRVTNSRVIRGGELGVIMQAQNELIDNCEVAYSNVNQNSWSTATGNAAGVKSHSSPGTIHRNSWWHHNNGPDIWFDDAKNSVNSAYNNLIEDHWQLASPGLMYEICTGQGGAQNLFDLNVVRGLHHSAVYLSECEDALVKRHKVEACYSGITGIEDVRAEIVNNVTVEDNYTRQTNIGSAVAAATSIYLPTGGTITFQNNDYEVDAAITHPFRHNGTLRTVAEWRALFPTETITTF